MNEREREPGRWLKITGWLVAASLLTSPLAAADEPTSLEPQATERIDRALRELLATRPSTGLSVGVSWYGTKWTTAYGFARLQPPVKATAQTSYRMASVTKTFTGVAIMQLVEQGKVDLDAPVQSYVPDFPKKAWPVTPRHLLSHLGGIFHYRDGKKEAHLKTHFTTGQALKIFADWPLAQEPGTAFLYTTYGYDLLGAVIEGASGLSYGEYLEKHVFGPVGMKSSAVEDKKKKNATWADGYRLRNGRPGPSEEIDISSRFAGGGTRSTVDDLLAFAEGLYSGTLVRPETWARMKVSVTTRDGQWVDYGLGFGVYPQHGQLVVAHLGSQAETTTLLYLLPGEQLAVALATNLEDQSALLSDAASAIVETLIEGGARRRAAYADDPVDAVLLEGLSRTYSYGLARRAGWGGADLENGTVDVAFASTADLLSRERIAKDIEGTRALIAKAHHPSRNAVLPRAGAAMAELLETELGAARLRQYSELGPIAFFADYVEVCARVGCSRRFSPQTELDIAWLKAQWERGGGRLGAFRPERAVDATELAQTLEPMSGLSVLPDLSRELSQVASRWRTQGREADAVATLELSARLFPSAPEAQLALADHALLMGDEARASWLYESVYRLPFAAAATTKDALLKRATALENEIHPRAQAAAKTLTQWAAKRPGEAPKGLGGFR